MVSAASIIVASFPAQVAVEEYFSISGAAQALAGQPLTLLIDDRFQFGAGSVPSNGLWSVRFRFTSPGDRRLVFFAQTSQGTRIESQPIQMRVVTTPPPPLQVTSFPHQVQVEEFLTINGLAPGLQGSPLTLTIDDRFQLGAGSVPSNGIWSVRFRFTHGGNRRLVFSARDAQGRVVNSPPVIITVTEAGQTQSIQITSIPPQVNTREEFVIRGTSVGLAGLPITIVVDNQFRFASGAIAEDGSWQSFFQFLQAGSRRVTAQVENVPGSPIISETSTINVVAIAPRLSITTPPAPIVAGEGFVLQGNATNFTDGEQLVVRADQQYVLARPIVQNQRWQANLFFHQPGRRFVEVLSSEQERAQVELTVQAPEQQIQIFPYTVWTSRPTPSSIPDLINPQRVTLHHTVIAALSANATQAQEVERMRRILDIHLNSSGYSDVGYHYIVMPSGRIYEGRSSLKRGAHDIVNDGFGVAVDGDFQGSFRIGPRQFDAIVGLCIILFRRMRLTDPVTPVSTLTADFGTRQLPRICGHRDRVATICPGTIYERMSEIRQAVRSGLT
jgi:hypothetical protein